MVYDGKYDIGKCPTAEEWEIYRRVFAYDQRENVSAWLEHNRPEATQEQFEKVYETYVEDWENDGEHDWEMLYWAANEVLGQEAV